MLKVLIVDDHQLFTDALTNMLREEREMTVAATLSSPHEAMEWLKTSDVDIVVMDIRFRGEEMDGMDAAEYINEHFPQVKVLMLTASEKASYVARMLKHRIAGYMIKDAAGKELIKALHTIQNGGTYYSMEVMKSYMDYMNQLNTHGRAVKLTPREKEILQLIVEEYSTQEIGDKLCIGEAGVETHRRNLRRKLNVKNMAGMVREAIMRDLVNLEKFR